MRSTWLRYLGFLGLLGLLGLFTGNTGFYGFFGFFGFFGFKGLRADERLEENLNRAARNAFVTGIAAYAVAVVAATVAVQPAMVLSFGLAISFALQMLAFTFSFAYYERG